MDIFICTDREIKCFECQEIVDCAGGCGCLRKGNKMSECKECGLKGILPITGTCPEHKELNNTQALADLLDDLTPQELTDLIFYCWVNGEKMNRGQIKGFRKSIGKSK